MRKLLIFLLFSLSTLVTYSQGFKNWFQNNVKIRQSMETSDLIEEPAQFQMTILDKDTISYLIDIGTSIILNSSVAPDFMSKINLEYHRNTMIKKEQNNFQIGYAYNWKFIHFNKTNIHLVGDAKFIDNRIDTTYSFGGNILFTWLNDSSGIKWNVNNFFNKNKESFFMSVFFGGQYQYIFKQNKFDKKGFILRPIFTANLNFNINHTDEIPFNPILSLSLTYTGRYALIKPVKNSESYTQLLKTGIDWYLAYKPVKVSLGISLNYGSDPIQGKQEQRYILISLNFLK